MISSIKQIVTLIVIISLCILSNSCKKNNKLLGTWILAYDFGYNDSIPVYNSNRIYNQFLTFEKKNYSSLVISPYGYLELLKGKYNLKKNEIKFTENGKDESLGLMKFKSQDSIILSNSFGINKKGYVRLADSLKKSNNLKLNGKSFLRKHQKLNDTITFVNDSIYKSSSFIIEGFHKNLCWKRLIYHNFDILYLDYFSPYIISVRDGVISLNDVINYQEIILQPIDGG